MPTDPLEPPRPSRTLRGALAVVAVGLVLAACGTPSGDGTNGGADTVTLSVDFSSVPEGALADDSVLCLPVTSSDPDVDVSDVRFNAQFDHGGDGISPSASLGPESIRHADRIEVLGHMYMRLLDSATCASAAAAIPALWLSLYVTEVTGSNQMVLQHLSGSSYQDLEMAASGELSAQSPSSGSESWRIRNFQIAETSSFSTDAGQLSIRISKADVQF